MRISGAINYMFGVCAALTVLAGCGGLPQSPSGPQGLNQPSRAGSWMSPDAKKVALLYVSDRGTNEVYAYSYKKRMLVGTLTGFNNPDGLCADKAGDVFVTEYGAADILEYAHGGTSPIATLSDPGEKPMGCSVDAKTGNLAVTNFQDLTNKSGNVGIYQAATGTPTLYSDPNIYNYLYCVYDTRSNLYVDGKTYNGLDNFAELRRSSAAFTDLTLNATINYAEDIQWKNNELVVGNTYENNQIFFFKIKNGNGTEIGYPAALTHGYGVLQFWVDGKVLIAALPAYPNVSFYNYPAGGSPIYDIGFPGGSEPVGVTISP
jgi:hypothetical protein